MGGPNRLYFITLTIVVWIGGATFAQSSEETSVAQAIERLRKTMERPDSLVLADLASDDLEYVHSSGTVRNKQGFIDEFMKGWTQMSNVTFSDQTITVSGTNAIVRHRLMADSRVKGYPPTIDIIILMVWRKEDGKWRMLARQAAKIPR